MKFCVNCKIEKPIIAFYVNKKNKDGFFNSCIECCKKRNKKWYLKNREKALQLTTKWRKENVNKNRELVQAWRQEVLN